MSCAVVEAAVVAFVSQPTWGAATNEARSHDEHGSMGISTLLEARAGAGGAEGVGGATGRGQRQAPESLQQQAEPEQPVGAAVILVVQSSGTARSPAIGIASIKRVRTSRLVKRITTLRTIRTLQARQPLHDCQPVVANPVFPSSTSRAIPDPG
jgi:hypothetical protein